MFQPTVRLTVTNENFASWIIDLANDDWTGREIASIVEKPHNWTNEFNTWLDQLNKELTGMDV